MFAVLHVIFVVGIVTVCKLSVVLHKVVLFF